MLAIGIIMIIAGIVSSIYGSSLNSSLEAQLMSTLSGSGMNPGNIWLYGGLAIAVIGIILIIVHFRKKR